MQIIPTDTTPYYQVTVNLDGDDYILAFRWNSRESNWYMDVSQSDGTLLQAGLKLLCNQLLLARFADTNLPLGDFIVFDNTGANTPPGLNDLDPDTGRCELIYYEQADLADISSF